MTILGKIPNFALFFFFLPMCSRNTVILPMPLSSVLAMVLCWLRGTLSALILQPNELFTLLFSVLSCAELLAFEFSLPAWISGDHPCTWLWALLQLSIWTHALVVVYWNPPVDVICSTSYRLLKFDYVNIE